jgi:arginine/lysine/ornithine decarboxylase
MKVAINCCYGGFGLSDAAFEKLLERKGIEFEKSAEDSHSLGITHYYRKGMVDKDDGYLSHRDFTRDRGDTDLITIIEEMGVEQASSKYAEIKIVEIPNDVNWHIGEYDGIEHVAENHRTWD